ncbi:ABC transporter substrate-binding protein [Paenibacillus humicola]|uniref:ABC transporter substrate-binding protein n=1 Tax=Paenibacillus humicola TaxID=3110540 RepID=UPI00237B638F|nr:extracellular solute-binding protein [Paenibacillus humicola]
MKKWLYSLGTGMLILSISACSSGGGGDTATKDKPGVKAGKTTVTLAVQQPSAFYETAKKKFEAKYPDIDLQIQVTEDYEKYQKTINAAILSRKGPDLFEISDLPLDDYVSKHLLLNMEEPMEQWNKNDYQMNILDALKSNGGLYAMPIGFYLRAFVGDGDMLKNVNIDDKHWTWKEFEEISKKLGESGTERRYAMASEPPEVLLQERIVDQYTAFVDQAAKKAKFDAPQFVETMEQIKKMYDNQVMTSEPADAGRQMFYSTVLQSPADLIKGLYGIFPNPKLLQKPEQPGGTRIVPASEFAIQAQSPVKEEAWKFIAFLLSGEGQSLQERQGFSLLKSVNEKQLDDIQKQVGSGTYKLPDGTAPKVPNEQFTSFKQFINTADYYSDADGKVISIIGNDSSAFFGGQKSAGEVAKLIQNKVTTVLNE